MNWNTFKTTWGYIASLLGKHTGLGRGGKNLQDIYNYLPINERISTSGQPTEKQFELVKAQGFTTVINLAPADAENSLADETGTLAGLGMHYIHLPVNFAKPTNENFETFVQHMKDIEDQKVWVHCAANMRVSAFMFRYRTEVLGEPRDIVQVDLDSIWEPFGVWKKFMAQHQGQN